MDEVKNNDVLTTKQLAERWDVKPALIRVMRMRKQGPDYFPVGDTKRPPIRYKLEDVLRYEAERASNSKKGKAEHDDAAGTI